MRPDEGLPACAGEKRLQRVVLLPYRAHNEGNIGGAAMDAEIIALFQELPADDKKVVLELARALANK